MLFLGCYWDGWLLNLVDIICGIFYCPGAVSRFIKSTRAFPWRGWSIWGTCMGSWPWGYWYPGGGWDWKRVAYWFTRFDIGLFWRPWIPGGSSLENLFPAIYLFMKSFKGFPCILCNSSGRFDCRPCVTSGGLFDWVYLLIISVKSLPCPCKRLRISGGCCWAYLLIISESSLPWPCNLWSTSGVCSWAYLSIMSLSSFPWLWSFFIAYGNSCCWYWLVSLMIIWLSYFPWLWSLLRTSGTCFRVASLSIISPNCFPWPWNLCKTSGDWKFPCPAGPSDLFWGAGTEGGPCVTIIPEAGFNGAWERGVLFVGFI